MRSVMDSSASGVASGGKQEYFPLEGRDRSVDRSSEPADYEENATLHPRMASRRKPSLLAWCAMASLAFLAILFGLSAAVKSTRHHGKPHDDSGDYLDGILGNWGQPGSGTEDIARYPTDFLKDVIPVPCHSHNDYWRRVPLFSAIHVGCIGIESDVWLYGDELYVGHDTASLQPNRTFRSLYIDPLVKILERQNPSTQFYNGSDHGVFDTSPYQTLTLLVDLKTGGDETWPFVVKQLEPLRKGGWLTRYENGKVHMGPITVVGTGNTPFNQIVANSTFRDTFFDAPLNKIGSGEFDSTNSYYASVSFPATVGRIERGELTSNQMAKIRSHVKAAHDKGLKARYWELPGWPIRLRNHVWEVLVQEGVDILNVDDLVAVATQDWSTAKIQSPEAI